MSGTMGWLDCWKMCVSCSPAALRKTPPAPPVTLLRYPAVNRFKLQQPPRPPQPPQLLPLLKVKATTNGILTRSMKSNCHGNPLIPSTHHHPH